MSSPEAILTYWLDELGPSGWYKSSDEIDAHIREHFLGTWEQAREGAFSLWLTYPSGTLAYCILLDQFPRNMFRGQARAFSTDAPALSAAKMAIGRDWDRRIDEPARRFFYMPLVHSESLSDQERGVRLIAARMPESGPGLLPHARAHREIIRRFGRFPYRNEALGRSTTAAERKFLEEERYGAVLRKFQEQG